MIRSMCAIWISSSEIPDLNPAVERKEKKNLWRRQSEALHSAGYECKQSQLYLISCTVSSHVL